MNEIPKIQISEFTGMGDNNLIYNSGFLPEKINGKSVMTSGFLTENLTGYKDISTISSDFKSFVNLKTVNGGRDYIIAVSDTGEFYTTSSDGIETLYVKKGLIHNISSVSDILELDNNNIIYSQSSNLGLGIRSKATGGSTTTIIDTTKNFTDLGISVGDKVTNLKNGKEEEITSITTTTNSNDTLNFDATTATSAGNEYIAWIDDKFDLTDGVDVENWQDATGLWKRQMKQYGDQYMILNGNYIAMISSDGVTIDTTYKQLPARHQALSFGENNSSILLSAEYKGKGRLLLWDGSSDGWNNLLDFDYPVTALISYSSGWLFVSRGTLYYTNGYSVEELSTLDIGIDVDDSYSGYLEPEMFNGLYYFNNKVYFANSYTDNNLVDYGIFCFDFKAGWTFIEQDAGYLYKFGRTPVYCIGYSEFSRNLISLGKDTINEIRSHNTYDYDYSSGRVYYSFIYYLDLQQETQIKGIGLNVLRPIKSILNDDGAKKTNITINISDGSRGLIDYLYTVEASGENSKLKIDGTKFTNNEVGDEIVVLDNDGGDTVYKGTRIYITAIENKGTATEKWTTSYDLGSSFNGYLKVIRLKKIDSKEISSNELNKEFLFTKNNGILSNKMFIEVVVEDDKDNPMPISISNINIY